MDIMDGGGEKVNIYKSVPVFLLMMFLQHDSKSQVTEMDLRSLNEND